jgi:hypothetical protein
MIVNISSDVEVDISQGYWFYEEQRDGLGDYFRDCIVSDIDSLIASSRTSIHSLSMAASTRPRMPTIGSWQAGFRS